MLYQIGLIAVIVVAVLILVKKFSHSKDEPNDLVYEDEMDDEELNSIAVSYTHLTLPTKLAV